MAPIALVAGPAILLIVVEPDLGTALVVAFTVVALLLAAGCRCAIWRMLARDRRRGRRAAGSSPSPTSGRG